jgi:nucleotide-binding universal stress UspA family protein
MLPKTIVVATDFSEQANRAIDYAVELARKMDARVYVVNAYVPPTLTLPDVAAAYTEAADQAADRAQRRLDLLVLGYHDARVPLEAVLRCGEPVDQVVNAAKQLHADLIVVGTHGRKGLSRALLGSVAESVVRNAPCAVLTVH